MIPTSAGGGKGWVKTGGLWIIMGIKVVIEARCIALECPTGWVKVHYVFCCADAVSYLLVLCFVYLFVLNGSILF